VIRITTAAVLWMWIRSDPTLFAGSEYRYESGKIIPVMDSSGSGMNLKKNYSLIIFDYFSTKMIN
jgi:hypothetical protein